MCPEPAEEVMFKLKTTELFFSELLVVLCPTTVEVVLFFQGRKVK